MSRHAIVIGATGAVGSALTRRLLASAAWAGVRILTRKPTKIFSVLPGAEKLTQKTITPETLEAVARETAQGCDAAFCTMGIGQPRKVSREELWQVEVEQATDYARGCRKAGVKHYSLMTAVGADAKSKNHYMRVKGTAEKLATSLHFERTSFFRPSLLVTQEIRYGLQDRLTQALFPIVAWFLPSRFHGIRVEDLGRGMVRNAETPAAPGVETLHYEDFIRLSG